MKEVYKLVVKSPVSDTVVPLLLDANEAEFIMKLSALVGLNADEYANPTLELHLFESDTSIWRKLI